MREGRLYQDSRQCRRCEVDYLYPAYGGKNVCGNCFDRYGRRHAWSRDTAGPQINH